MVTVTTKELGQQTVSIFYCLPQRAYLTIRLAFYTTLVEDFWTDDTVNNPNAADPRNQNVPGDGKFDETLIDGSDKTIFSPHMIPYEIASLEVVMRSIKNF